MALLAILSCSIASWLPSARAQELSPSNTDAIALESPALPWLLGPEAAAKLTSGRVVEDSPSAPGVIVNTTPGDITVADGTQLSVTSLMDITGVASATHVVRSDNLNDRQFAIVISGASGSLRAQGGIQLGTTTTLTLTEGAGYTGVAGGRLSDTALLQLDSASLAYVNTRSPATNFSETIGTLRVGGFSTLTLGSTTESTFYGNTTLIAAGLERLNRGTFEVTFSETLGSGTNSAAYVRLGSAPATTAGGVVPYATAQIASQSANYGVVIYEAANGLRQLTAAEYTSSFAGVSSASQFLVPVSTTLTNDATLTVGSLTVKSGSVLNGNGLLNIASGLVLQAGGNATVSNALAFGSQEAFIALPNTGDLELTFLKPLTGTGGLTVYGRAIVAFPGGNQIAGDLVLNGRARIRLGSMAELGPATTPVQVNGLETGAGIRTTASLDFNRVVQVNSGYFSVSPRAGAVTLSGGITGGGGLFVSPGAGNVVLTGTNTYTGPTLVQGNLSFSSDAAFGNSSSIVLYDGTLKLLSNWTSSRPLVQAYLTPTETYLNTNGFDADLQGNLNGTDSGQIFTKTGAGRLLVQAPLTNTSLLRVGGGQILVQGSGSLAAFRTNVITGGTLLIDNSGGAVDRGTLNVTLSGGEYEVVGHATQTTTIHGLLYPVDYPGRPTSDTPSYGVATFLPAGNAPILLDLTNYGYSTQSYSVVRGGQLAGGPTGAYTRIRFAIVPTLVNGILPHLLVDAGATGFGTSFSTYDTSSDAGGVLGVRALKAAEYATAAPLGNPANGGSTATTANFLASGVTGVAGAATTVGTLTLAPGSRLALGSAQRLNLGQNVLLVQPGAMAEITAGTVAGSTVFSGTVLYVVGGGDLRLGATVPYQNLLYHLGPGLLKVTGPQNDSSLYMWGGSLQAGPGNPLIYSSVKLDATANLDLLGTTTRIGELIGSGTVNFGGGTLQVEGKVGPTAFAGPLSGSGTFTSATSSGVTLSGASPFTGTLATIRSGGITITGTLPALAGITTKGGTVTLDYATPASTAARVGVVPVDLTGGLLNVISVAGTNTAATLGTLTGDGLNRVTITNNANGAANEGRVTFANLNRRGRGAFSFSTVLSASQTGVYDFVQDLTPLLVGDTSAATSRPILPYGILDGHPATFDPGVGLRRLTAGEQVATFAAGQNVKMTADTALNTTVAINSFEVPTGSILSGTGTLKVTSGLAVANGPIQVTLDFGAVEGHIFIPGSTGNSQISGVIAGSNGLTISNPFNIAISGNNTFTGPLTINGAQVTFKGLASLGADSTPVVLAGGSLIYNGGSGNTYTLSRGIDLEASGGHVVVNTNYQLTASGPISGPGDLYLGGVLTLSNASSSYTGTTFLIGGTIHFASDAVFGQSPLLSAAVVGSSLVASGSWVTSRAIDLPNSLTVDTGSFDSALNGKLTGMGSLFKQGTGVLTIADAAQFTGTLHPTAGTVRLASDLGPSTATGAVTVDVAGRLEGSSTFFRDVALNGTLAPGVGAAVGSFETGNITMAAGAKLELQAISPTDFDQLRVNGTVTLNGLVQLVLGVTGVTGNPAFQWPILLNDGTDAITVSATKAFAINSTPLTEGATFNVNGFNATITYKGGDGNDVYVTIPEPGCAALGAFGLAGLLARRPARRQRL